MFQEKTPCVTLSPFAPDKHFLQILQNLEFTDALKFLL